MRNEAQVRAPRRQGADRFERAKARTDTKADVLPNENAEEFEEFRMALRNDFAPQGALEEVWAEKFVADAC